MLAILRPGVVDGGMKDRNARKDTIEESDDGWDFVSYKEHPIAGIPSFFLHPCQTAKRLHLLMAIGAECDDYVDGKKKSAIVLLSWLSMILLSTGFHMSPRVFCAARKEIKAMNTAC